MEVLNNRKQELNIWQSCAWMQRRQIVMAEVMKKTVAFAIDDSLKYQRLLLGTVLSFRKHHSTDWTVRVHCVGTGNDFKSRLLQLGCEIRNAPRTNPLENQSHFPCSAAKCLALTEVEKDEVVLTADADGLFLSNVDPLVDEFLKSGCDVALLPETDKRGNTSPVRECWFGCPLKEFKKAESWMDKPILNCGIVLSHGQSAQQIGKEALRLVQQHEKTLYLGEQGPINAVIYDNDLKVFSLKSHHHCIFISESNLTFGKIPYIGDVLAEGFVGNTLVDGKPVVYRHFGSRYNESYQKALDWLLRHTA
jgi:hypothetical protein